MGKVYRNETHIVIPQDTLVLICGSQNSGKTTFTKKHFANKNVLVTDDIFEEVIKTEATASDTLESLACRTTEIFDERIRELAPKNSITVVDAAPFELKNRMEMIKELKGLHTNIVLIVLDVRYPTFKSRPKKKVDKKKKMYGITPISDQELLYNSLIIAEQIRNGEIGYKVTKAYALCELDIDKCQVTFE